MLTRSEFRKHAEIAAAHRYGEKHEAWLTFRQRMHGPLGAVSAALVLGLGALWLWHHVHLPSATAHVGLAYWLVVAGLALVTALVFRIRVTLAATALVRIVVAVLLWLGVVSYGVFVVIL